MDSPLGTHSVNGTSCHISSPLDTPVTPIEIEDTPVIPIEIEDVETSASGSMPVGGHGRGGRPPLPRKKRKMFQTNLQRGTISLEIKVPLMMILSLIAITVGLPTNVTQRTMTPHLCCIM
jgi:hypothetical protein